MLPVGCSTNSGSGVMCVCDEDLCNGANDYNFDEVSSSAATASSAAVTTKGTV